MKTINYLVMGLFVVSLIFVAGNSFSQSRYLPSFGEQSQSAFAGYREEGAATVRQLRPASWACSASIMIASELKSSEGDYLAEISDLVIDPADGRVSYVVLSQVRGMGAEGGVIPFGTVTKTGDAIYLYNAYEDYRFIGEAPFQNGGWGLAISSEHKPVAGVKASKLIGAPVRTSKGKDLGRIEDLIVDHMGGHVLNFVVSGREGKRSAVPFGSLSESGKGAFILKSS